MCVAGSRTVDIDTAKATGGDTSFYGSLLRRRYIQRYMVNVYEIFVQMFTLRVEQFHGSYLCTSYVDRSTALDCVCRSKARESPSPLAPKEK